MVRDVEARQLGFWKCTALVVGNIIGAGIFLLPASIAPFGANNIWGWSLAIGGSMCLALTLAKLASGISGGPYAYVKTAFGAEAGFLVMWTYWTSIWTANATLAIAVVSYASSLVPALGAGLAPPVLAIGCLWIFTLVNMRGAGVAGSVQVLTAALKLLPLIAVCGVALWMLGKGSHAAAQARVPVTFGGIGSTAALAMFSMLGFECATLPAGKIINETRTIPLATVSGTLLAGIITLAACGAVLFLLPSHVASQSHAPFADAIAPALGHSAGTIIAIFGTISALGCLNGWVLCSGEVPLTMSQAGVFPEWFGKTTPLGTPVRAQIFSGILASILIWTNYSGSMTDAFTFIVLVSTDGALVLYGACALAALRLKQAMVAGAAGVIFTCFALWGAGLEAGLWGLALVALGVPIWWLNRRSRAGSIPAAAVTPGAPPG
jgi:APA family basic amino acid/polyamine antiporter